MAGWVREREAWVDDEDLVGQAYQRYLLQLQFVDSLIGRFLDKLKGLDIFEESLIVVTADHGVGFQPGGSRRHISSQTVATVLPVPLFVKLPHQTTGTRSDANVEAIDILATIADAVEMALPATLDGVSAFASRSRKPSIKRASAGNRLFDFPTDLLPIMLPEAERSRRRFGINDTGLDLWQEGLARGHVGRLLQTYRIVDPSDIKASLDPGWYSWSRPPDGSIPSLVSGELESLSETTTRPTLVASLNGQVSDVSRAFATRNGHRFSFLLPSQHFRLDSNDLRLFLAETRPDGELELAEISGDWPVLTSWISAPEGGDVASIDHRGRAFVISPMDIAGQVDLMSKDGAALRIAGWAGDRGTNRPPMAVLVFAGDRQVYETSRMLTREDVALEMGASFADSGFDFTVSSTVLDSAEPSGLRVLALFSNGTGAELRLPELTSR